MTSRVRDRDRGAARLEAALGELVQGVQLTVGVHEDDGAAEHEGSHGASVAAVAAFVELGTEDEAPRSFVRASIDEASDLGQRLAGAAQAVADGGSVESAFGALARELVESMRERAPAKSGQVRDAISARVGEEKVG